MKTNRSLVELLALDASCNLHRSGSKRLNHEEYSTCAITLVPRKEEPEITDMSTVISLSDRNAIVSRNIIVHN